MIKVITPLKRKPGMTVKEFRNYYETKHRVIGEKYLLGFADKYVRRFTNPVPDNTGNFLEPEFDVLLEVWYPDMESFNACVAKLSEPDVAKEIKADEAKLFDVSYKRSYFVEEFESEF